MLRPVALSLIVLSCAVPGLAREPGPIRKLSLDPVAPVVELFAAAEAGSVAVRVVPLDETEANVFIGNSTAETLTVAIPPTIALVSVHPQFQQPGLGLPTQISSNPGGLQQGSGQSTGGSLDPTGQNAFPTAPLGQGNGANNPFAGNNFFSIPPHREVWLQVHSVCLDHGRPTPRPKMPYALVPIEKQIESPILRRMLADFDPAEDDRTALQAAAWHLANDLDWRQLAALTVTRGNTEHPRFTHKQLEGAWHLVDVAKQHVEANKETPVSVKLRGTAQ